MRASRLLLAVSAGVAVAVVLGAMAIRAGSAAQEGAAPAASEVLIIWCGGTPGAQKLPPPDAGPVDAVTQATPETGNIQQTADALGKALQAAGHTVKVVSVEKFRDPREILSAKALVLASPDYFGLPPWQMVRFCDEILYRFYQSQVKTPNLVVTAFATTDRVRATLEGAVKATGGKAVEGAVVTSRHGTDADREKAVKDLAGRIAAAM